MVIVVCNRVLIRSLRAPGRSTAYKCALCTALIQAGGLVALLTGASPIIMPPAHVVRRRGARKGQPHALGAARRSGKPPGPKARAEGILAVPSCVCHNCARPCQQTIADLPGGLRSLRLGLPALSARTECYCMARITHSSGKCSRLAG